MGKICVLWLRTQCSMLQITVLNNHAIYVNFWQIAFCNSCLVMLENFKTLACRRCWKVYPLIFIWWDLKGNCRGCVPTFYLPRHSNFCTLVKKNCHYVWTKEDNCVESFLFCKKLSRLFVVPLTKSESLLSYYMWSGSTSSRISISRLFYFIFNWLDSSFKEFCVLKLPVTEDGMAFSATVSILETYGNLSGLKVKPEHSSRQS
jgi:hypothetical protein